MNKSFEFGKETEIICERNGFAVADGKHLTINVKEEEGRVGIAGEISFDKTTEELFNCDEESFILPFDIIIKKDKPITLSNVELLTQVQFDEEGHCVPKKIELDNPVVFIAKSMIGVE